MDIISQLHDELLLTILSLLPTAKDVVATMVLSKRWQFLWMMVPKLVYNDSYQSLESGRFSLFVERSLFLHKAHLIETLHFKLGHKWVSGDLQGWIRAAVKSCLHALIIEIDDSSLSLPVVLPLSLFCGGCRMLVALKLCNMTLVDASSSIYSFPSLKKLSLKSIKYPSDEFVKRVLSNCPVLEDLVVEQCEDDNVTILAVMVPSLKRLVLQTLDENDSHGFVIDAPSLEYYDIFHSNGFCVIEDNMTKVVDAKLVFCTYGHQWNKLGSITSLKRLFLCVPTSKDVYPVGSVLSSLVHLKICTCETGWLNLLMRVLKDSPNLLSLKLKQCHFLRSDEPRPCWIKPDSVPDCFLSKLETFKWVYYEGSEEEKEVAAYILSSASCLKKATVITSESFKSDKKLEIHKELFLSSRRSPECQLEFSTSY